MAKKRTKKSAARRKVHPLHRSYATSARDQRFLLWFAVALFAVTLYIILTQPGLR